MDKTFVKVKNMESPHSGKDVPNQFIINLSNGDMDIKYFQSYESIIASIDNIGKVCIDENTWDYSSTTTKYRNKFFDKFAPQYNTTNKLKKAIENSEVEVCNLNKHYLNV